MAVTNDRKRQRVLHHASSIASTMKNGQRKFIPRQRVNGGKVMVEKGSRDNFRVYMPSDKRFTGLHGKKNYGIEVFKGSNKGIKEDGVYRHNSDVFKNLRSKLFSYKSGKRTFKEGKTGSMGG